MVPAMGEVPEVRKLDGTERGLAELRLQIHRRCMAGRPIKDDKVLPLPERLAAFVDLVYCEA
jgi:hypothetical protein